MKIDFSLDAWCRGRDCKYHPAKKLFKKRAIKRCSICKKMVQKDLSEVRK